VTLFLLLRIQLYLNMKLIKKISQYQNSRDVVLPYAFAAFIVPVCKIPPVHLPASECDVLRPVTAKAFLAW